MVMYAGKVVEYNSVTELFSSPKHPYTQGLLQAIPRFDMEVDELYTIKGNVPILQNIPVGCRFADRCQYCQPQCRIADSPLFRCGEVGTVRCWLYAPVGG